MIKSISQKHLAFILFLSLVVINFITSLENDRLRIIFNNYFKSAGLIFLCIACLFFTWIAVAFCFKKEPKLSLRYSGITLFPLLLLLLWRPQDHSNLYQPIITILLTQLCFFLILSRQDQVATISSLKPKVLILILIVLYCAIFGYIATQKFNSFSFFNSKDFGIYNQTFYNSIEGRLFLNSTYGSNFACHNSPFYFLLLPFYLMFPHPLTLIFLKIGLLALSAIPFYLIARLILKDSSVFPFTLTFLFYPFLISQNLTAPHEICYSPFFILFTYYFFRQNRFLPFMIFLILAVSIKEHFSMLALLFGIYALFSKKRLKWVLSPALLGIFWGIFSLWIIQHFQKIYQSHTDSAWFILNLSQRFLSQDGNFLSSLISGFSCSNISNWYSLRQVFLLISPLGIILPLISPVSLLGLPELTLNLLSDRPGMLSPVWHYNIIVSCFILIGTLEGVKKISHFKWVKNLNLETPTFRLLLSVFILACTLTHSYTWLRITKYERDTTYINTVKQAISIVPKHAFITVPQDIAVHISNREQYSLIESGKYGDYILVDNDTWPLLQEKEIREIIENYTQIFHKNNIVVYKK